MSDQISLRKAEHLDLAQRMSDEVSGSAGWSDIHLVHQALPSIDADMIDISTMMLGRHLSFPLIIPGMTGGHPGAVEVNRLLASAAEKVGVAIGVGSQRAALEYPELTRSYAIVREEAPTAFVVGNIGISQLISYFDEGLMDRHVGTLIEMIGADALAVHLNYLEEVVQPEGQTLAQRALNALAAFVEASPVPVIAKETGGGLSVEVARTLRDIGVSMLDVGGRGGTSFAAIEAERSRARGDHRRSELGTTLDKNVWSEFRADWTRTTIKASEAFESVVGDYWIEANANQISASDAQYVFQEGQTREAVVQVRQWQYL